MRIAVVDDERPARSELKYLVEQCEPEAEIAEKNMKVYSGRVEALESILLYLKCKKEKYVIMMDANIAVDFDFNAMLAEHMESGADVTVAYTEQEIPAELIRAGVHGDMYYTLKLDDGRVRRIFMNSEMCGKQNPGL